MNNPEYAKIGNKKYRINTDYRYALKCDKIAKDKTIGDFERALAIIYTLYGDEGLKDTENHNELLRIGLNFLRCGKQIEETEEDTQKIDTDLNKDFELIYASFMSDYQIDLQDKKMHWWTFNRLINGLSNSELGNCCIYNKVRNIRNMNPNEIKDYKTKNELLKAQKYWNLEETEEIELTDEQNASKEQFLKDLEGV